MKDNKVISIREFSLPDSKDLEQQLLSDLIASPDAMVEVARYVTEEAFTTDQRRKIWRTISGMFNRGESIDMTSLLTIEGDAFLKECVTNGKLGGTARSAVQHAIYLRDAAARRRAYFTAIDLLNNSIDTRNTENDLCALAEAMAHKIQGSTGSKYERHIKEVLADVEQQAEERREMKLAGKLTRVPTGLKGLDFYFYGGFRNGQLVVIAARPGVGKTALMMLFAKSAAKSGFTVVIFSLEMADDELGQRLLYSTGKVEPVEIVTGLLRNSFTEAADEIRHLPIYINDSSRSLEEIESRLVMMKHAGKCDVAYIDYVGLMNIATGYRENMNQAIAKITGELKALAKRLKIPIVLLCQLNRDSAKGDRAPELYDLRDSGAIEQDADIVMMLENEKAIEPETGLRDINIWLRKNRQYKKDICITVRPNKTYSDFTEIGAEIKAEQAATLDASDLSDDDENTSKLF